MKIEDIFYVNKYEIGRAYGGPEEGGWWFNYGQFMECEAMFTSRKEARALADALTMVEGSQPDLNSVNTEYVVSFSVEDNVGQDWPQRMPHYE